MKRTAPTTTLQITKPKDYSSLQKAFQLIRYEIPQDLRWRLKNASYLYGQIHNLLRDQLDCPYKTYMYDQIDDGITKWVVYALYLPNATPAVLNMPLSSNSSLYPEEISFKQLPLHILLKLLQITFVRGHSATRFIGQDHCYFHAKKVGEFSHVCLRIDLKGDIRTDEIDVEQEFKVRGSACLFRRVRYPEGKHPAYTYFGRKITQKRVHFLHLKRAEIDAAKQRKEPIYGIGTRRNQRTTLAYHNLLKIEESTGKLLADFIHDFTAFLKQFGITSKTKNRHFSSFIPPKDAMQISLSSLNIVRVYDNRLNRTHTLQDYLHIFNTMIPNVQFVELSDFSQWNKEAVLILQDYNKKDFDAGKPLEGQTDPYSSLYNKSTLQIPKQSININMVKDKDAIDDDEFEDDDLEDYEDEDTEVTVFHGTTDYLNYELLKYDDRSFKLKLKAALTQLYLKEVICLRRSVSQWLPLALTNFLFLRRARTIAGQEPYETALLFEHDALRFIDLRDPEQKDQLPELCARFGINWKTMEDRLLRKYRKREDGEPDKELSHYDIVIGPNIFIELEDADERVLYNYSEIVRRQDATKKKLLAEAFKLLPYFDDIRSRSMLSRKDLQDRLLLQENSQPRPGTETDSLTFYRQLEEYDAFLDAVQQEHATISLKQLLDGNDEIIQQIARIFHLQANEKGKYNRRKLKRYYKKRGYLSDKANDVQMYEGIWYDDEHCYMVGSGQPMKQQQPTAHLIRHFDVYQGEDNFDIQPFLLTMSVQFVRYNQYTVFPYPFHLIDVYVENVLRYQ